MLDRRDPSSTPTPGTHAPDFITPLAYASLAIPILFLVVAGIWIALRFGSSNLNPADVDMHAPDDEDDEDEAMEHEDDGAVDGVDGEKKGGATGRQRVSVAEDEKAALKSRKARTRSDGQDQPLLEEDEEEDDDEQGGNDEPSARTAPSFASATPSPRSPAQQQEQQERQDTRPATSTTSATPPAKPTSKWKLKPGFSSTATRTGQ